jgi:hypothetical protein
MMDDGYMSSNYKWTPWKEKFAWFPKYLYTRKYLSDDNIGYWTQDNQWVWLKRYYERSTINGIVGHDVPRVIYDHETDIFGVLKKS